VVTHRIWIAAAGTLALMAAGCASKPPASTPESTPTQESHTEKLNATNVVAAQYAGYKLVNRNGEKLYCRRDATTGSRVEYQTRCLTEEEMRQQQSVNRRDMERIDQVPQPVAGK